VLLVVACVSGKLVLMHTAGIELPTSPSKSHRRGIDVVRDTYDMMSRRDFRRNFRRPSRILRTFAGDSLSIRCPFSVYCLFILCVLSSDSFSVRGAGQQLPPVSYHPIFELLPFHLSGRTAL
jgi:hypothetical protein